MANQIERKVGIYVRLSKEDSRVGESVSIENQKLLLTKHCRDQGWELVQIFQDDGFSGTNQNRPGMQNMFTAVRQGIINTVLIKDLSRLGRNYLEVGNLAEVFLPEHGCELVSLNEKVDEMMVFRNWLNEQHSKDTSKKVRAVKRMCAQNGKYMGTYAPYGYRRDPQDKHRFLIDENTAPIVRQIFTMRIEGSGYKAIAYQLNESGVVPPRDYYYQQKNAESPTRNNHFWNDMTVKSILLNEVYIGNLVQAKAGTMSYKNHKSVAKPKEEWIRVEGTHEAIIDREIWAQVQKIAEKRYQPKAQSNGDTSIFSGLLVCANCGYKMRVHTKSRSRKDGSQYHYSSFLCGNYARSGKQACTAHIIREETLYDLVLEQIREHARIVNCDEAAVVENLLLQQNSETESSRTAFLSELKAHKLRLSMLEKLIQKLYEDWLTGMVPEAVFKNLIQKYEQERIDREMAAEALETRILSIKQSKDGAAKWASIIKEYTQLETLDALTLLRLVDRIEVGDDLTVDGQNVRKVQIIYNYVGDIGGACLSLLPGTPERMVDVRGEAV